jgi:hypothetical protein
MTHEVTDSITVVRLDDPAAQIASLLHRAGQTHHVVYRMVDGDDPDWASWYADWLVNLSALPRILGSTPPRSELVWLLVALEKEYGRTQPDLPWPHWYAEHLVEHFGVRRP